MFVGSENVETFSINIYIYIFCFRFFLIFHTHERCMVILNAHNVDTLGNGKAPSGARGCPQRRLGIWLRGEVAAALVPECSERHTDRGRPRNSHLEHTYTATAV